MGADDDIAEGTLIADKYRVESPLGRGGMGVVYRATHRWTGRPVAVKVLRPEYAREEAIVQRFMNEARAAALLRCENVVDVLDMGADAGGALYLALELLEGESLAARLGASGRLGPEDCARALLPAMDALAAAHDAGIVHRDVKPDNIFLHRAGGREVPKLLDFGVAKFREQSQRRTTTGTVLGTVLYMSPEQAQGLPEVGPASDVWAVGVVWYECLTGAPPFCESNVPATLLAITQGRRAPLAARRPDVARPLVDAVERALAVDVAARWPDMRAFAAAVRRALATGAGLDATMPALEGAAPVAPPPVAAPAAPSASGTPGTPTAEPWVRPKAPAPTAPRARALLVAAVAALVGGGVAGAWVLLRSGTPTAGDAPRAAVVAHPPAAPAGAGAAPAAGAPVVVRPAAPADASAAAPADAGVEPAAEPSVGRRRGHRRREPGAEGIARQF